MSLPIVREHWYEGRLSIGIAPGTGDGASDKCNPFEPLSGI